VVLPAGCLLREAFGGPIGDAKELGAAESVPEVGLGGGGALIEYDTTHIQKLRAGYQKLLTNNAAKRLQPKALLELPFFGNVYVKTCLFLENLAIKDSFERDGFFK
jgi:hypothetical protein